MLACVQAAKIYIDPPSGKKALVTKTKVKVESPLAEAGYSARTVTRIAVTA